MWKHLVGTVADYPSLLCVWLLFLFFSLLPAAAKEDKPPNFPDDDQIRLLLSQADRAFQNYESAVNMERLQLGDAAGAEKDQEVSSAFRELLPKLKQNLQMFNSPFGFLLIIDLDDASRNMAVCMSQGGMSASNFLLAGNTSAGRERLLLAQTCMDATTLLYTVSETATKMYEDYLLANAVLQDTMLKTVTKCSDVLQKQRDQSR
jgi:hypothetical protein